MCEMGPDAPRMAIMKKYASCGHRGRTLPSAMALLVVWSVGCSDDSDDAPAGGSAGTAGAGATVGASGSAGAGGAAPSGGGGMGGAEAAGGRAGSSSAGSGGTDGTGTGGLSGSGPSGSGGETAGGPTASLDAGTGLGGGAGEFQRCETAGSCLEFRGHSPTCQVSNEANCANISNGTYFVGPCPTDQFELAEVEETFCGPTAAFLRVTP